MIDRRPGWETQLPEANFAGEWVGFRMLTQESSSLHSKRKAWILLRRIWYINMNKTPKNPSAIFGCFPNDHLPAQSTPRSLVPVRPHHPHAGPLATFLILASLKGRVIPMCQPASDFPLSRTEHRRVYDSGTLFDQASLDVRADTAKLLVLRSSSSSGGAWRMRIGSVSDH